MAAGVYFLDDEPALARRLDDFLAGLGERLAASPAAADTVALVLSGGYGRGEGGVFRGPDGAADLYNDLEFYLLLRDGAPDTAARAWCEREERDGTAALGIDVEFKRLGCGTLRRAAPSMFYYDLVQGHRLVWGDPGWRAGLPAAMSDAAAIPLHEATRLLFNRGTGLFFSRCALAAPADPRVANGFVQRNHAKVRLALGDAVLAANGRYHQFARERNARIHTGLSWTPPDWDRLVAWHDDGVDFKLHPRHAVVDRNALVTMQAELAIAWRQTFLWLEGRRLGVPLNTAADYTDWRGRLFPETARGRNVLLHVRDWRARGGTLPGWTDYPRAALQRALVRLVDPAREPDFGAVSAALGVTPPLGGWSEVEPVFARWWSFYN